MPNGHRAHSEPRRCDSGRLLIQWANSQDAWASKLTAETILSRETPGEDFLDTVYDTFLAEKGLPGRESPDMPKLEAAAVHVTEEDALELSGFSIGCEACAAG